MVILILIFSSGGLWFLNIFNLISKTLFLKGFLGWYITFLEGNFAYDFDFYFRRGCFERKLKNAVPMRAFKNFWILSSNIRFRFFKKIGLFTRCFDFYLSFRGTFKLHIKDLFLEEFFKCPWFWSLLEERLISLKSVLKWDFYFLLMFSARNFISFCSSFFTGAFFLSRVHFSILLMGWVFLFHAWDFVIIFTGKKWFSRLLFWRFAEFFTGTVFVFTGKISK